MAVDAPSAGVCGSDRNQRSSQHRCRHFKYIPPGMDTEYLKRTGKMILIHGVKYTFVVSANVNDFLIFVGDSHRNVTVLSCCSVLLNT